MHAVHEAAIPGTLETDWQSAYGYGGPIVVDLEGQSLDACWQAIDSIARQRRVVAEFVRFHPLLENHRVYPGTVRGDRPVVQVDLKVANLLASYGGRARTAVRKASALGLQSQWLSQADAKRQFPDFYRRGMAQIGAEDFYLFSDAYFEALLELPEAMTLSVDRGGEPVAMGVFLFGPAVAEYHLSATSGQGRATGATNLLLHAAAERAQQAGLTTLYLGGGTDNRGDNPLLRFKSSYASPQSTFHVGYRIHDADVYGRLRVTFAQAAQASSRVLFYRG